MKTPRLAFIDWMKVLGMLVIVLGHTGADELWNPTPPFNFKQLGVAFFVFVMGFSLAGETRSPGLVVYNRLFDMYWFGLGFALLTSVVTWLMVRDLTESNYLPLLLGVNVFFDNFPANPTTWYIGTYIHLVLLWWLAIRRLTVKLWMVLLAIGVEIPLRALLIESCGNFIAYMAFTNWLAIFLFGLYCGQRHPHPSSEGSQPGKLALAWPLIALVALSVVWPSLAGGIGVTAGFPYGRLNATIPGAAWLPTSAAVSFLYVTFTWLLFRITSQLPALRVVEFLARNTLLVFIVHMPLVFWLCPYYYPVIPQGPVRVLANVALFFLLPAAISELIRRLTRPTWWRDRIREKVEAVWGKAAPALGWTR